MAKDRLVMKSKGLFEKAMKPNNDFKRDNASRCGLNQRWVDPAGAWKFDQKGA
jgi:hypothetical protein